MSSRGARVATITQREVALAAAGPHIDLPAFRADLDRAVDQGL